MKRYITKAVVVLLVLANAVVWTRGAFGPEMEAHANAKEFSGANIQSRYAEDFASEEFRQSLQRLRDTGANYVALVVPVYQSNRHAHDIGSGWNTPSDNALAAGIDYAHSIGLSVMIKMHPESHDGAWRGIIDPFDTAKWFEQYTDVVRHYGRIAENHGAEIFCIGTELVFLAKNTSGHTSRWEKLIDDLRSVYGGAVTYEANSSGDHPDDWISNEKEYIDFWDKVDYITISAYFSIYADGQGSVQSMKNRWHDLHTRHLKPFADKHGKQIIFGEVGYRSIQGSNVSPFDSSRDAPYDDGIQARAYEALLDYWKDHSYMAGVIWWDWTSYPDAGGAGDKHFTPQNKPAEEVLKKYWGNNNEPEPPPPADTDFRIQADIVPVSPNNNDVVRLSTNVSTDESVQNVIVDIEVYGDNGRVAQEFYENQSLGTSAKNYNFDLNLVPGEYYVHVGIFSSGWSSLYVWKSDVLRFTVRESGSTPNPPEDPNDPPADEEPKDQDPPPSTGVPKNAFRGQYYNNEDLTNLTATRIDPRIDFDWGQGRPIDGVSPDTFSVRWEGDWEFDASGEYEFSAGSDDGVRVWVDNNLIIDEWVNRKFTTNTKKIHVQKGIHRIKVEYFEGVVGASVKVGWNLTRADEQQQPDPDPGQGIIDVWWPTNEVAISGTQPLKALVPDRDLGAYRMYWQVDGDGLKEMEDSFEDWPHKEVRVNVGEWRWNGDGPYTLDFVARDKSTNQTIAERKITVYTVTW